jgi:hypothetical protein
MAKMQAHSLAELVRFVEFLKRAPRGEGGRGFAPPDDRIPASGLTAGAMGIEGMGRPLTS